MSISKMYHIGSKQLRAPSASIEWKPIDIAGCKLWLDANQGITKDVSNYVSQWADQSGNGNNATQITGVAQPLYVANQLNGEPVIRFDGNDYFDLYKQLGRPLDYTCMIVINVYDGNTRGIMGSVNSSNDIQTSNMSCYIGATYGIVCKYGDDIDFSQRYNVRGYSTGIFFLLEYTHLNGGNQPPVYINSNFIIGQTNGIATSSGGIVYNFCIGRDGEYASSVFKGDIAEIIIYNSVLDDTNRSKVENYLNDKYNIY